MDPRLVDELEEFVRRGAAWDAGYLETLTARLDAETAETEDPVPALLSRPLRTLLARVREGPVPARTANDVEAVVYPRLWKIMEAARYGLPEGELRTRVDMFDRQLTRRLGEEGQG